MNAPVGRWGRLPWKWKLPLCVLGAQLAVIAGLLALFGQSRSEWIHALWVVAALPFLGPWLYAMAWLVLLYLMGVLLDRRKAR